MNGLYPAGTFAARFRQIFTILTGICGLVIFPLGPIALFFAIRELKAGYSKGLSRAGAVLGGCGCITPVLLALAIPNSHGHERLHANEAAAATTLKHGIGPAMLAFRAHVTIDEDKNATGESGFLNEVMTTEATGLGPELVARWQVAVPEMNGYRYAMYLPNGATTVASRAEITDHSPAAIAARETHWIVYAWPVTWGETGRHAFAITEKLQVLATPRSETGEIPSWNAALSNGWGSPPPPPGWGIYKK